MSMQDREGDFVWYELMTDNADAAQEFYGSLLGWDFTSGDAPGIDYRLGSMTDTEVVGVMQLTPEMHEGGARPAWIGYIAVTAIDDALTRLDELGGRVLMGPDHMEGVGHMAMVTDPQGAPFYLIQTEGEASQSFARYEARQGHCAWNELVTDDPAAAGAFYSALVGWEKGECMDMGEMGPYQMYAAGDYTLGAMMKRPDAMPVSLWCYYFRVPDIDAAQETVERQGGQVVNGPMEVPGGEFVLQGVDPQGAMFSLIGKRGD